MKNAFLFAAMLAVAAVSYGLGRWRGDQPPSRANSEEAGIQIAAQRSSISNWSITRQRVGGSGVQSSVRMDSTAPFAQNLRAAEKGYLAAQENLTNALAMIDSLPVSERMGFITGIFSYVSKNHSPADALKIYQQVPEGHRPNALRALVAEWIYARSPLDADQRFLRREGTLATSGSRLGLEVELTGMLASSQPDPELALAWMDAFSQHRSRSEIISILAGRPGTDGAERAAELLRRTESWTAWEKERVARNYLNSWAQGSPQDAWNWYQSHREQLPQDYAASILQPWAYQDPEGLKKFLDRVEDPAQRVAAHGALGKVLGEKNTDQAVAWADAITDPRDRDAAHRAIYDAAPRGIGAVLDFEKGFPKLRGVVPGGPLDGTGAKAGDYLVGLREANGADHLLYGRDLQSAVNLIRGEQGTQITLRVLRENGGQIEEHLIPVTRGQLYLDEKRIPKPPG